jgi:predicted nucleic-acid-binding protein
MKSGKKQQPGQRVSENRAFIDTSAILRLLVKDDPAKTRAVERVLKESKDRGIVLSLLPVTILEIVWVMEKVYRLSRKAIRELVEAILLEKGRKGRC